jgi:dsRNA-specific ribonuclease
VWRVTLDLALDHARYFLLTLIVLQQDSYSGLRETFALAEAEAKFKATGCGTIIRYRAPEVFKCFQAMFAFSNASTAGDMTVYCRGFKSKAIDDNLRNYLGHLVSRSIEETWDCLQKENIYPSREYYLASGFCIYSNENVQEAKRENLRVLEKSLGYHFDIIGLLSSALDDSDKDQGMDPLEYLGDALLELVILRICAQRYQKEMILQIRFHVVARNFMTTVGNDLHLHLYSPQPCPEGLESLLDETKITGLYNPSKKMNKYYVDRLEAIVGAIFLDCHLNFEKLEHVLFKIFTPYLDDDLPRKIKEKDKRINEEQKIKKRKNEADVGTNKKIHGIGKREPL